jgi:hypothetical protein
MAAFIKLYKNSLFVESLKMSISNILNFIGVVGGSVIAFAV